MSIKDAWSSNAIDIIPSKEATSRQEMIQKHTLLDDCLSVYNQRLENVISLGDKLLGQIMNTKKKKKRICNTLTDDENLQIERRERCFYDFKLRKWCGYGDTLLRNVSFFQGKMIIDEEIKNKNNSEFLKCVELNESLFNKFSKLNFDNLDTCPSLKESQVGEKYSEEFGDFDNNFVVLPNNENCDFVDNIEDDFIEDQEINNIEQDIEPKQVLMNTNPFSYTAWAGPSAWKISKKNKKRQKSENKRVKFDFFESYNKLSIISDRKSTLFKEQEIIERRKNNLDIERDFYIKVEDIYAFNLITSVDCFVEKKVPIHVENENITDLQDQKDAESVKEQTFIKDVSSIIDNSINNIDNSNNLIEAPVLKVPVYQKKITMKELQEKIKESRNLMQKDEKFSSFKSIFTNLKSVNKNNEMFENVSWQYFVVAMLELASRGLKIGCESGENVVYLE